jgi:SWI/SNF-related matrix-associated actin-dependent regulator of chromatin subfamily A member 5
VRFGATRIFSSKEATITDEDIDAIINRGNDRTKEQTDKLKQVGVSNLANFSLTSEESNLYEFEGKTFDSTKPNGGFDFVQLPKREHKQNLDVNAYYKDALAVDANKARSKQVYKPKDRHDFQFFQRERLESLERKDFESKQKYKELEREAKDAERAEKKERKANKLEKEKEQRRESKLKRDVASAERRLAAAAAGGVEAAATEEEVKDEEEPEEDVMKDEEDEGDEEKKKETAKEEEEAKEARRQDLSEKAGILSEEEMNEMAELKLEGFDWNKTNFRDFLRTCATYGRKNIKEIQHHVNGQTPEAVKKYWKAFMERGEAEIDDWDKANATIEAGELKLEKVSGVRDLLQRRVKGTQKPYLSLKIPYPPTSSNRPMSYTPEEDRWLVCMTNECGYGDPGVWLLVRKEVRLAWQFRFDWFFKSRTAVELQKRTESLIKYLEKDEAENTKKTKASSQKRKAEPASAKKSSAKKSGKKRKA